MNNAPTQDRDGDEETLGVSPSASSETPMASPGDATPSPMGRTASRLSAWRRARVVSAETRAEQERLVRLRREQEQRETQERASQAAATKRRSSSRGLETEPGDDVIAPLPMWLRVAGVWFNRTFGALPLAAPLVVSAIFTIKSGVAEPLSLPDGVALALALAFEGGIWKTATLYEKTRIEGDSTAGHRLLLAALILLNAAFILSHSIFELTQDLARTDTVEVDAAMVAKWAPAMIVALMSTMGVLIWGKQAAYKHRARLREKGLVDARAPKFSAMSWILCPWDTWCSLKHATRYRLSSPILAVEDRRLWKMSGKPKVWPAVETVEAELLETETPRVQQRLHVVPSLVSSETAALTASPSPSRRLPSPGPLAETTNETGAGDARLLHQVASLRSGTSPVSYAEIGKRLGISKAHAGRLGVEAGIQNLIRPGDDETDQVAN